MNAISINSEPMQMRKRIGSTVYEINVYVKNDDAAETMDDKIMRLVRNDLNLAPENGTIKALQTGGLLERGSA